MATSNQTSGTGSTLVNRVGWFLGLNFAWFLLALLAAWLGWRSYTLSSNGNVAEGKVVQLLEDETAFDSDFTPIVEFQVDGVTYSVQSQNSYRWWNRYIRFKVGGPVEVRYEVDNPNHAEINSWWDLWNGTIILSLFTIVAAIGVNVYLFFRWRGQRAV